mgnify:CR=1 FL=1
MLATAGYLAFVMTCAAASFAALALSLRLVSRRVAVLDHLRDNAYAIYVVHFVFVSWLQYALRPAQLSALTKGSLVFLGAVALELGRVGRAAARSRDRPGRVTEGELRSRGR